LRIHTLIYVLYKYILYKKEGRNKRLTFSPHVCKSSLRSYNENLQREKEAKIEGFNANWKLFVVRVSEIADILCKSRFAMRYGFLVHCEHHKGTLLNPEQERRN